MARRVISAFVGIFIGISIMFLNYNPLFLVVVSVLSVVAVYEMLVATKYITRKLSSTISLLFVFAVPVIFITDSLRDNLPLICSIFLFLLFMIMILRHEKVQFEELSLIAFVSVCIPLSFSCLLFIKLFSEEHGIFLLVFTLLVIWIGDAGAYFIGTFFGRHKMAPKISPKKSWEGFIGGLVCSGLAGAAAPAVYAYIVGEIFEQPEIHINLWFFAAAAVICSALGVMGDFSASIVKRQCSVKDFGNIMPGHGGVLDRFDSVLFAAPFMYQVLNFYMPIRPVI